MSEYTFPEVQTMSLDKFNSLAEKQDRAGDFIKHISKLSYEIPEPR